MCSQKRNCTDSVPISTFMYLWAIYIFLRSVYLFSCSTIGTPIVEIYVNRSQKHERRNWDWGRAVSILGIFVSNVRYTVFAVHPGTVLGISCQSVFFYIPTEQRDYVPPQQNDCIPTKQRLITSLQSREIISLNSMITCPQNRMIASLQSRMFASSIKQNGYIPTKPKDKITTKQRLITSLLQYKETIRCGAPKPGKMGRVDRTAFPKLKSQMPPPSSPPSSQPSSPLQHPKKKHISTDNYRR